MHALSQPVVQQPHYAIWRLDREETMALTPFVYDVYFQRFHAEHGWLGEEYEKLEADDRAYLDRTIAFAAKAPDGTVLATMRGIRRERGELPIERDFDLDAPALCRQRRIRPNEIWEIARTAKSDEAIAAAGLHPKAALMIFDDLIAATVRATGDKRGNVWFASIDNAVLQLMLMRGFQFRPVADPVTYMGSPTTPVMLGADRLKRDLLRQGRDVLARYFGPESVAAA